MQSTTREGRRGYYLQTSLYLTTATAGDLSQSTVDAQLWMDAKTPSDSHLSKTLALVGTRDLTSHRSAGFWLVHLRNVTG
jgi:hypothetical protein